MDSFLHDLRYGVRMLVKSPGVSALAILALALGIGANVSIFSFVDALYYRPLPVSHPERLVAIYTSCQLPAGISPRCGTSSPDLQDVKAQAKSLQDVAFYERRGAILMENGDATHLLVNLVSDNWMEMMGIKPAFGRAFTAAEQSQAGTPPEVMLSHTFWKSHYGSDRNIVGKTVTFTGRPWVVVGVLPEGYRGTDVLFNPELTLPMSSWTRQFGEHGRSVDREYRFYDAYGRLRDGASVESLNAELATISSRLAQAYPKTNASRQITAVSERDAREGMRNVSRILLILAACVLLIACANVANLLFARGESRRREVATRLALGASRIRVARQLLVESGLLAALAAGAALLFANWTIGSIPALLAGAPMPVSFDTRLDVRVILFALGAAFVAVFLFGLAPAVSAARGSLLGAVKTQTGSDDGQRGRMWLRDGMVVGQMAISLMLILSTGLLLRSLLKMDAIDPGFAADRRMLIADALAPDRKGVTPVQQFRMAQQELASLPGVQSVAFASRIPMSGSGGGHADEVMVPGKLQPNGRGIDVKSAYVSRGYFETMGTRLLRGRVFEASDDSESKGVAVINQAMARKFWGDEDAVGKHFRIGARADGLQRGKDMEVIGVVQDGKYNSIIEPADSYLFLNMSQFRDGNATFLVSTSSDPAMLATPVRKHMRDQDGMTVLQVMTLSEFMRFQTFAGRLAMQLVGFMCALDIFLAAMGLYGVVSYLVGRRTHEIGIRMALGAQAEAILRLFMRRGVALAALGIAIGLTAALAMSTLLGTALYGVSNRDPLTYVIGSAMLLGVAAAATYLPARRATRIEPMEALRYE